MPQYSRPLGERTPRSRRRCTTAMNERPSSAYQPNSSATIAASAGSVRTPAGSRGRSGSARYPYGGRVHGSICPPCSLWSRPRRSALGDERALVLGHRPADLQEQLVLGIVGERPVGELDPAAVALQLLQEQHLMDIVARQSIRIGDEDAIELGQRGEVAKPVEAGPPQRGPGIAVVAEDVVVRERPSAISGDAPQSVELLIDGLGLGLALGRDPDVDRDSHRPPPGSWVGMGRNGGPVEEQLIGAVRPPRDIGEGVVGTKHLPGSLHGVPPG